jgi:hypothetical protein
MATADFDPIFGSICFEIDFNVFRLLCIPLCMFHVGSSSHCLSLLPANADRVVIQLLIK